MAKTVTRVAYIDWPLNMTTSPQPAQVQTFECEKCTTAWVDHQSRLRPCHTHSVICREHDFAIITVTELEVKE